MNLLKSPLRRAFFLVVSSFILFSSGAEAASAVTADSDASILAHRVLEDVPQGTSSSWKSIVAEDGQNRDEIVEKNVDDKTVFEVQKIVLIDSNNESRIEFTDLLNSYQNKKITLKDATGLARVIEDAYRRQGFLTTLVVVPPQTIEDGVLKLEVIDGRMGDLIIDGNKYFSSDLIKSYWLIPSGEKIEGLKMLESLRYLNSNEDRQVRAILRPGKEKGLTDVYLKAEDRLPIHLSASVDNKGQSNSGRYRPMFFIRHNNFLIPDSVYIVGSALASHFGAFFNQYIVPLDRKGTQLILGFTASQVSPKGDFKSFDINGVAQIYSAAIKKVWIQTERFVSHVQLGFDAKETRTQTINGLSRRERLRIANVQTDFQSQDEHGTLIMLYNLSMGIDGLGASDDNNPFASRSNIDADFFYFQGHVTRTLLVPPAGQMALTVDYQLASKRLPSSEQMFLGGMDTVRGYPESDFLADQGIRFSAEYISEIPFVPNNVFLGRSKTPLRKQIQWVVFFDEAYGSNRFSSEDEIDSRHLMGVGSGLQVLLSENCNARFEVGHALGDEPLTASDHTRFHFKIQVLS